MLADATTATIFASRALPVVLAETTATTILASRALPVVLAETTATTLFALRSPPVVLADANAATILTIVPLLVVRTHFPFPGRGFPFALSAAAALRHNLDIWIRVIGILFVSIIVHNVHAQQARATDLSHSRNDPTVVHAIFELHQHFGTRRHRIHAQL